MLNMFVTLQEWKEPTIHFEEVIIKSLWYCSPVVNALHLYTDSTPNYASSARHSKRKKKQKQMSGLSVNAGMSKT